MKPSILIELDVQNRRCRVQINADDGASAEFLAFALEQTDVFGDSERAGNPLVKYAEVERPAREEGYVIISAGQFNTRITEARMRRFAFDVIEAALSIGFKHWSLESGNDERLMWFHPRHWIDTSK